MKCFADIKDYLAYDFQQLNKVIAEELTSNVVLIEQISNYIIHSGGKRLRPLLLLLSAKALNYNGDKQYLLSAIIEFIHTATLLHDDVVDDSDTRHNQITANNKWGNSASILTGDFLYSRAFEMMVKVDSMQVMSILARITNTISEGEVMQLINCQNEKLTEKQYFQIIYNKTACLFQASTQLSAVIANTDKKTENAMLNYGLNLGNTFQIIDDILDYKSDSKTIGKEVGDDLKEGKVTLPIIYALKHCTNDEKLLLETAIKNADNSNIRQIISILDNVKAFDYAKQQAKLYANKAKMFLKDIPDNKAKKTLELLADISVKREF